jgi:hypothetical protein
MNCLSVLLLDVGHVQIDSLTLDLLHLLRVPLAGMTLAACGHAPVFRSACSCIGATRDPLQLFHFHNQVAAYLGFGDYRLLTGESEIEPGF